MTIPPLRLGGSYVEPETDAGVVVFAHGSGSSRFSPRNRFVAGEMEKAGLGTLLFDLLRPEEAGDRRKVFDIPLLAGRLAQALDWLRSLPGPVAAAPIGLFGASTGAAAALVAAATHPSQVQAVVSRGGRPDLAGDALGRVRSAGHLFEEPGTLDVVVLLARDWFAPRLGRGRGPP